MEQLPVEYLSVDSQVRCILLTMTLSVLLTINHCSAAEPMYSTSDCVAATETDSSVECSASDVGHVLERVVRLMRLSLADSRTVHVLMSTVHPASLLHCFSALQFRLASEVIFLLSLGLVLCQLIKPHFCFILICWLGFVYCVVAVLVVSLPLRRRRRRQMNSPLQASFLAAFSSHSGDWLFALPIASCGLRLDDEAVRVAVRICLGLPICRYLPLLHTDTDVAHISVSVEKW